MAIWAAFEVQRSHSQGRAFIVPDPAERLQNKDSECV